MKRKALAVVLIAIIALAFASWFIYNQISALQNQISELQERNSTLEVQISEIQDQLNETQNKISEQQENLRGITYELALQRPLNVLITKFNWTGGWYAFGGMTVSYPVNVTVRNNDVVNLSGLTLSVRLLIKGTLNEVKDSSGFPIQIDELKAGESQEILCTILATLWSFSTDSAVCAVRLSVRDVVLDEGTYNLS
jgi:uncharacterized coiled-coil protein SlyX